MDHSLSSLLFQENQGEFDDEDLYVQFDDSEEEYLGVLIEKEIGFGFGRDEEDSSLLLMSDWIKSARLYAINWILKVSFNSINNPLFSYEFLIDMFIHS